MPCNNGGSCRLNKRNLTISSRNRVNYGRSSFGAPPQQGSIHVDPQEKIAVTKIESDYLCTCLKGFAGERCEQSKCGFNFIFLIKLAGRVPLNIDTWKKKYYKNTTERAREHQWYWKNKYLIFVLHFFFVSLLLCSLMPALLAWFCVPMWYYTTMLCVTWLALTSHSSRSIIFFTSYLTLFFCFSLILTLVFCVFLLYRTRYWWMQAAETVQEWRQLHRRRQWL